MITLRKINLSQNTIRLLVTLLLVSVLLPLAPATHAEGLPVYGFVQGLWGGFLHERNPVPSEYSASEVRLQLKLEQYSGGAEFFARTDFVYDDVTPEQYNWELREGYVKFTLFKYVDFKVGRQISTWGTGDLIFINDVFAKDYESFFSGRDDQYLKAPQNSLRVEYYSHFGTFSMVWTPEFTPNRIPDGQRFSYFTPMAGTFVGGEPFILTARMPESTWENSEMALRYQNQVSGWAVALYGYRGFYKNPVGFDPMTMMPYYPRLNVYGASVRGQVSGGILWFEGGYFDSREDKSGTNPFVPNRELQGLAGYERQVATNLTANIQYQAQFMLDHDKYVISQMGGVTEAEVRSLITSRLTKTLRLETIILSSFIFYSPSDEDVYYRFNVDWKYSDNMTLTFGGNLFDGTSGTTEFGAFMLNDNLYGKVTYGF